MTNVRTRSAEKNGSMEAEKTAKTDAEWRKQLPPESYRVTRRGGTERFTGASSDHQGKGLYRCVCCGTALFRPEAKFDSGTGWPSFRRPAAEENVLIRPDTSHGMSRTEARCALCGAHLGYVFPDGPPPGGIRWCMNPAAVEFVPDTEDPGNGKTPSRRPTP